MSLIVGYVYYTFISNDKFIQLVTFSKFSEFSHSVTLKSPTELIQMLRKEYIRVIFRVVDTLLLAANASNKLKQCYLQSNIPITSNFIKSLS